MMASFQSFLILIFLSKASWMWRGVKSRARVKPWTVLELSDSGSRPHTFQALALGMNSKIVVLMR